MSKKPKKRNKQYTGKDAAVKPTVHHYQAVVRSPMAEWWHDHKRAVKLTSMIGGGGIVFIYLMYEFLMILF